MEIQFGTNTPISDNLSIPLDQAKKKIHIVFKQRKNYGENDLFTTVVRDPDAPNPDYIHLLVVNSLYSEHMDGDVLIEYYPPQRVGHRYIFEIYRQRKKISTDKPEKEGVDFKEWSKKQNLEEIDQIVVTTTKPNKTTERIMHPNSYCRCILHVHAKNLASGYRGNPYAICAKSTGKSQHYCMADYNFNIMPLDHLVAFADLEKIKLSNPTSRNLSLKEIENWVAAKKN